MDKLQQHQKETAKQFEKTQIAAQPDQILQSLDQRFDRLEQKLEEGFYNIHKSIDQLGQL